MYRGYEAALNSYIPLPTITKYERETKKNIEPPKVFRTHDCGTEIDFVFLDNVLTNKK